MRTEISKGLFRRASLFAAVFLFSSLFRIPAFAQSAARKPSSSSSNSTTSVSRNGIILSAPVTEKVDDEDVKRIEMLDKETAEEYEMSSENGTSPHNDSDDIDALFVDSEDTEDPISTATTEIVKVDSKGKPINFSGSLKSELGGYLWFDPLEKTKPLANFRNILSFTGRPSSDFFVTGSLLMDFQDMKDGQEIDIGLYEIYFDYTLFGLVDIMAGKRDVSWSLSRMLDTDILDDEGYFMYAGDTVVPIEIGQDEILQEIFIKRDRTTSDSRFTLSMNIPIFSYGSIQGVAQYHALTGGFSNHNISVAGKVEGSIGKFSLSILAMKWPNNNIRADEKSGDSVIVTTPNPNPAVGFEAVTTIFGKKSNIFVQGLFHLDGSSEVNLNRMRFSSGAYKYWENPIMLGVAVEYQGIWDNAYSSTGKFGQWQHYFAAQVSWSHFILNKKWTFGCEWFHDCRQEYGTVLPVLVVENVMKYTNLRFAFPIYYGSQKKYGMIFEVILNLDY